MAFLEMYPEVDMGIKMKTYSLAQKITRARYPFAETRNHTPKPNRKSPQKRIIIWYVLSLRRAFPRLNPRETRAVPGKVRSDVAQKKHNDSPYT